MRVGALRVLVAEDSLFGREVLCTLLEQQGHEVTAVGNGADAIAAAATQEFDLALLDVELPDTDGPAVAAAIRTHQPRVAILAVTGHTTDDQKERCAAAGMDGFLSKPVRPEQLFRAMERTMGCRLRSTALLNLGGNPRLLEKVVDAFRKETPRLLDGIRSAIAANDAPRLHRLAHTLHGSIRYFNAPRAAAWALRLQKMGTAGEFANADDVLAALAEECAQLDSRLADHA